MPNVSHYRVHALDGNRNPTGATWDHPFTVSHARDRGLPDETITEDGGLPYGAAHTLCRAWTRASANHDGAFAYTPIWPKDQSHE